MSDRSTGRLVTIATPVVHKNTVFKMRGSWLKLPMMMP